MGFVKKRHGCAVSERNRRQKRCQAVGDPIRLINRKSNGRGFAHAPRFDQNNTALDRVGAQPQPPRPRVGEQMNGEILVLSLSFRQSALS